MNGYVKFDKLLSVFFWCIVCSCSLTINEERELIPVYAGVGEYAEFKCDLDFPHDTPIPYILNWNRDEDTIFQWYDGHLSLNENYKGRIHLLNNVGDNDGKGQGSINLTNIRESDQGIYECKVIFPNRTPNSRNNGTWFNLIIHGASAFPTTVTGETLLTVPPVNKTIMEGEVVRFDCVAKSENSTVRWFCEGVQISEIQDLKRRASIDKNGTLIINSAIIGDIGEYTCVVTDEHGEQKNASAFLDVQYKAKVIYAPREILFSYGKPALLDCHFRANPPLTNLRWEKDGFLFDSYNVPGVFYSRNGSLYFSKVDEIHSGNYSCTPYNKLGTEGPSPLMHVRVQGPPIFMITPQHMYVRKLGESLEIPCEARDNKLRSTIVWNKDGLPLLPKRTKVIGGNLTIEKIEEHDRGLYQCVANNEAGMVIANTELMVLNAPPRAPYNLSANSSKNAVTLTWVPLYVRPKLEYFVWYRPTDTSEWRSLKILSRKITEATINNLSPGREYEFMILSQDKHGEGMFSKSVRVFTLPGQPGIVDENSASEYRRPEETDIIGSPINVTVQETVEGYLVTWTPPEYNNVKFYTVRWFRGPTEYLYGRAETTDTYYLIKNLEEESYYTFEVATVSNDNEIWTSDRVRLTVKTSYHAVRVSKGIIAGIGFIASVLSAIAGWWARKRFCKSSNEK